MNAPARTVRLLPAEERILAYLKARPGETVSPKELHAALGDRYAFISVQAYVSMLRKKLGKASIASVKVGSRTMGWKWIGASP